MSVESEPRHMILLVDDDPAIIELYRELLSRMPSNPEVVGTTSGTQALTLLEEQTFRVIICDLRMPKIDGLQVLSIVRRRFPMVRTVAMTSVLDEQFRARAYAMGVDLFWHKPATEQELQMFLECLESLLGTESEEGFRGVQSKSLMDLIQLECMSQSSVVLRINNGPHSGKIWIQDGEIIDAEAGEAAGERAFLRILGWKNGTFESLAAEPNRERTIMKSSNGLLLESAQALDEAAAQTEPEEGPTPVDRAARHENMEFVVACTADGKTEARGLASPEVMAKWTRTTLERFTNLSEQLHAGPVQQIDAIGMQRQLTVIRQPEFDVCFGWKTTVSPDYVREVTKKLLPLWAS